MQLAFLREVERVNRFRVEKLPLILKIYRTPIERWPTPGRQALFGAPWFFAFFLFQRFWPFAVKASACYQGQTSEKTLRINPKNTQFLALYVSAFSHGYEPQTSCLVNLLVPATGVFYDIGSNWGWFSLSLAARKDFRGKIHAFEPFPSTYADLRSLIDQAELTKTVIPHQTALSDRCGTGVMRLPDHVQSGLATLEEAAEGRDNATPVSTLDSLGLEPPSLMKVDVEGGEEKVFKGGANLISKHGPMIVFEHARSRENPSASLRSLEFLESLGYDFYRTAWVRRSGQRYYLIGDEPESQPTDRETLGLVRFEVSERFMLPDLLNIFACHKDKRADLEAVFQKPA